VHLVGFIIRIYHDARSSECQKKRIRFFNHGENPNSARRIEDWVGLRAELDGVNGEEAEEEK